MDWDRFNDQFRETPSERAERLHRSRRRQQAECQHDFQGWREFSDGRGGERVCTKCGMGAMAHTLSLDI
ncbi:hypothetical protein HRJ34_15365 [Rhizorhabdus wittichii]|uniref:Uncharacterized protein n=1 Tax=Rhizorhabdus wittichii TaxID=160791 RepID=A0A975CYL4_9SPHN|nr:hypothetical protein [Rhizorhabdus wittichii]QTH19747.1 hypothetical protein HRJ34_15365 [Rhizorhabdus wittichii]